MGLPYRKFGLPGPAEDLMTVRCVSATWGLIHRHSYEYRTNWSAKAISTSPVAWAGVGFGAPHGTDVSWIQGFQMRSDSPADNATMTTGVNRNTPIQSTHYPRTRRAGRRIARFDTAVHVLTARPVSKKSIG